MLAELAVRVDEDGAVQRGTAVEVRNRFEGQWTRGFEVVSVTDDGYRVRRLSDGAELPTVFVHDDVRAEKKRTNDMWWY